MGICLLDIKPSNLLVRTYNPKNIPEGAKWETKRWGNILDIRLADFDTMFSVYVRARLAPRPPSPPLPTR